MVTQRALPDYLSGSFFVFGTSGIVSQHNTNAMAALTTDQIVFGEKIPSKALFRVKRAVCTNARLHLAVS